MSGPAPDDGEFPRGTTRRSRSPPEEESERKRKRKALSCYDCRRRKLKCDRQLPVCGRCIKGGHPETCVYESHVAENHEDAFNSADEAEQRLPRVFQAPNARTSNGSAVPAASASQEEVRLRFIVQENRIAELERRIATLEGDGQPEPPRPANGLDQLAQAARFALGPKLVPLNKHGFTRAREKEREQEPMIFQGRGFKTQFWGASQPSTLLVQFPELKSFMKDAIKQHPTVSRVSDELRGLKDSWKVPRRPTFTIQLPEINLFDYLPDRKSADHFMELYFSTFQKLYSIVHAPSFWAEYDLFWTDPASRRPGFLVLVLLIIASVRCMSPREASTFVGMNSTAREKAIKSIAACEAWLNHQSYKHSSLDIYQAYCILTLAKIVSAYKRKMIWTSAGTVLRAGAAQGLHRDPSLLGGPTQTRKKTSVFDQEMRRRLWATILELELITSFNRGMPSASAGFTWDTFPPSNIYDEDLNLGCTELPPPRRGDTFTSSSFLNACHRSISLRITLNALVNNPSYKMTFEDATMYTNKIMEELDQLPQWANDEKAPHDLPLALLEVQLRHFLILLHMPFVRKPQPSSQFTHSIMVSHDAATRILELHSNLWSSGTYAMSLMRFDVYQCAISLCHNTLACAANQTNFLSRSMSAAFPSLIDSALVIMEQQIQHLGEGYQYYWFACAASGLTLSKTSMTAEFARQHATDRMVRLYYKIMGSQDRPPPPKSLQKHPNEMPDYTERPTRNGVDSPHLQQTLPIQTPSEVPMVSMATPDSSHRPGAGAPGDPMSAALPEGDFAPIGFPELSEWDIASFWTFDAFNTFDQFPSPPE